MPSHLCPDIPKPGFSSQNIRRNAQLITGSASLPKVRKTGTCIAGLIFKDGIVLGADTRATEDTTVADKNCNKIHYIAPNIYCCGAGTAADIDQCTKMVAAQLELFSTYLKRTCRVNTANQIFKQHLFNYGGQIGAAIILAGVDSTGMHLYSIFPHGSSDKLPYTTLGSGCLASMGVFESNWKPNMREERAVQLVRDAVAAGIMNDLGSGSNIDICIIRKLTINHKRTYEEISTKGKKQLAYHIPRGTTIILNTDVLFVEDANKVFAKKQELDESDDEIL